MRFEVGATVVAWDEDTGTKSELEAARGGGAKGLEVQREPLGGEDKGGI